MADDTAWRRSPWTDAGQIAAILAPEDGPGAASGKSLPEWYAGLIATDETSAAAGFLAQALPRYECVVWATQGLLDIGAIDRSDPLVTAVLRWIDDPDDQLRRSAAALAEQETRPTAARFLAQAIFFSGGSLAPPNAPAVQPPPEVCGKLVAAAVVTGVYSLPNPRPAMRQVLAIGEKIATGD